MRLIDEDDLDGLFERVQPPEIADAWWRYALREKSLNDDELEHPDAWAYELWLFEPIYHDRHRDELVHELAERAPDGADLGLLGAAVVENCIGSDEESLRWVEQEAARSVNFQKALATVWIEEVGPAAFLRVQEAAKTDLVWHVNHGPRPMPDGSFVDPALGRSMT